MVSEHVEAEKGSTTTFAREHVEIYVWDWNAETLGTHCQR